jgi:PAS domain S-box-containing protein
MTVRRTVTDRRDQEISRLRRRLAEAAAREREIRAEERERFSSLTAASRRFAASMRSRMDERQRQQRRLDAQYAVSRALEESRGLPDAAPEVFYALGTRLGWDAGALWTVEAGALVCGGTWRLDGAAADGLAGAFRDHRFPRGAGLPGRVWEREAPCWVEDVLEDGGYARREEAADGGLRCALAFPIQDGGRLVGVFELLKREPAPVDEDMVRTAHLIGHQMGQFVERRRAEAERDRALSREREARRQIGGILESITDAFFAVDRDWRLAYVNGRTEEFWGRSRDDLRGKSLWEEFPEAVDSEVERALRRAMEGGETVGFETISPASGGGWISVRAYPSTEGLSVYFQDISERKEAEGALRQNEARWRTLIDKGADVITISARDGTVVFASPSIETVCGHEVGEFVGTNPFESGHIHPDDVERCGAAFAELAERPGHSLTIQHRYRHGAGGWRWLEGTFTNLFDDPAIGGLVANFRDVTERKEAEETLRESGARFRAIADLVPDLLWSNDAYGYTHWLNGRWLAYTGQSLDEAMGYGWLDAIHPGDRETSRENFLHAIRTGEPLRQEHRIRRADGRYRWFLVRAEPMTDEDGRILRWFGAATDVHENRTTFEALRENEEWLRIAQRAARSGTWEWDLATGEIRWSSEHRELFGLAPSDEPVSREEWWAAIHPEDLPRVREAGRRCSEEGAEWPEIEYRIQRDGGTRWIYARARTVRDEEGRPARILGISVDVTERREVEAERDRLRAQEWIAGAEAAERERISRELHDRVAHSMGVAHQSLQLYEVLAEKDAARAAEKLDLAKQMTKASLESTRNLSAELRYQEAEEGLETELRHLLDVSVPPGVRAGISVTGDESPVPGYIRGQLFLILREAVRNAVAHADCDSISVGLAIGDEKVIGRVRDDGIGFDANNGHAGVGLRSMRERAALLNGSLSLTCQPGEGTLVEVAVPLGGER